MATPIFLSNEDLAQIKRIAEKKSIRKVSRAVKNDLDAQTLSKMISAYLVLKADGHSDKEFMHYLETKQLGNTLSLGFKTAKSVLPSLLMDGEFRSLVMNTRKNLSKEKKKKEHESTKLPSYVEPAKEPTAAPPPPDQQPQTVNAS